MKDTEEAEFLSAGSSPAGSCASSEPGSPAGSTCSSVDSEELQALLEELQIVPPRSGKRQLVGSDGEDSDDASSRRPVASPRLEGARSSAPLPPPPPAGSRAPFALAAAAVAAVKPAVEPEVIELLDSSEGEEEEEWRIAAPATTQKRRVVDSDSGSDNDGNLNGADGSTEAEPSAAERALPPFFAAIPSLKGTGTGGSERAAPLQQQQPGPSAVAPHWQSSQQHAAPPPATRPLGTAAGQPQSTSAFKKQREELTAQLFKEFNRTVFEGQLPRDLEIRWNARLLTTAGLTHYKRDIPDDPYAPPIYTARVELSSKVLDCFSKLERTLCHELCHVAAWLVNQTAKPPHGPVFRAWAAKAMALYTHLDITTCHAYEIFYPYRWQCSNGTCLQEYGRHSNSIDVKKKVCGACRSPLVFLGKFKPDGTPAKQRAPSKFAEFVRENASAIKAQLPAGTPQKEVMQRVAGMFAAAKQQQQQQQHGMAGSQATTATTISLLDD